MKTNKVGIGIVKFHKYNQKIFNLYIIIFIIIIIKNECHSNIIVDRLQGCIYSTMNWHED